MIAAVIHLGSSMLIDDLPMATLVGTNSESLAIQFWQDKDVPYAEFAASLSSPSTTPPINQQLHTCSYNIHDASELRALLDGNSEIRFGLDAIYFDLEIYEHSCGARYGFIAETNISTIKWAKFAPWPKRRQIGDYLLDDNPTAGCLKFAFVCEYDALRDFAKQLDMMHRKSSAKLGG